MTDTEIDAIIAQIYAERHKLHHEAWLAFEAALAELRADMLRSAGFVQSFGHLVPRQATADEPPRHSMTGPPPGYDDGQSHLPSDGGFQSDEERAWWERTQSTPRRGAQL